MRALSSSTIRSDERKVWLKMKMKMKTEHVKPAWSGEMSQGPEATTLKRRTPRMCGPIASKCPETEQSRGEQT